MNPKVILFDEDLPDNQISFLQEFPSLAVDTETTGLNLARDRLLMVQIATPEGGVYIIKIKKDQKTARQLSRLLTDSKIEKVFHFARFDLSILMKSLNIEVENVFCTKISSKLVRTYSSKHGLKDLCLEMLGIELDKKMQTSDWSRDEITEEQLEYAANDVLYLHELRDKLRIMLEREERLDIARQCFEFLNPRAKLDLMGWQDEDIFSH